MSKKTIILPLLFLVFALQSQDSQASMKQENERKLEYQIDTVANFDGLSCEQIRYRTKMFIVEEFEKNTKNVITVDEANQLIVNASMPMQHKLKSFHIYYTLSVRFKDGKAKYSITKVSAGNELEKVQMERYIWTKGGKKRTAMIGFVNKADEELNSLIGDCIEYIKKYADNEW